MRALSLATSAATLALLAGLGGGEAMAQSRVGVAGAVNPQSQFDRSSGLRTVVIGDNVLFNDRIITGEIGLVQVLFVDGSTFTVGPTARVVIDEFVFNPSDSTGSLVAEVTSGALRFVGGKLSKRGNTVRFRTPGGTLGVRGGIINLDLAPPCLEDGRCPTQTASFVFGDELTLDLSGGGRRRIHQAGYSFAFFGNPSNPTVEVVPTSLLDQSALQTRLAGRAGASGGSPNIPTDTRVADSGVPPINSARAPLTVLPKPKPYIIVSRYSPDPNAPGITNVTNVIDDTVIETSQSDFVRTDVAENEPIEPVDPIPGANGIAAFATPDTFVTSDGVRIEDPGATDIVAAVDIAQYNPRIVEQADGQRVLIVGEDRLPFPEEEGETEIAPFNSRTLIGVRGQGAVIRGPDDFALYYLEELNSGEGDPSQVLYLVTGTPTPSKVIFPGSSDSTVSVRAYTLSDDFQKRSRGIASELRLLNPLVAQEFGSVLGDAAETPFLMATRQTNTNNAQTFYGGLLIDGSGAEQRSAVNVDVGFVDPDAKGVGVVGFRRGSYRVAANLAAAALTGPTGTLATQSGDDFSSLFGKDGESLVYTTGIVTRPTAVGTEREFFDRQRSDGILTRPDEFYSAVTTPGQLASKTAGADLSRATRTLTGYAAGMMELSAQKVRPFRSTDAGDFTVSFNAQESNLGGVIGVTDVLDSDPVVRSYNLAFGTDIFGGDSASTRGTYVDDDTFAGIATGPANQPGSPQTTLTTDDGAVVRHSKTTPDTYMISADAVPQPKLFEQAGVEECECRFLEWGWWGTATDFESEELEGNRKDFTHLGTWAAGDVTRDVDLPTSGTGSYQGHAVGSVVSTGADGARQRYVAVGDLDVNYNFGRRTGRVAVSNFDGKSFSGNVAGGVARDGVSNQFSGRLSGSDLTGQTRGAFVRGPDGPAQGVIGAFDVQNSRGRYRAVGNYVGETRARARLSGTGR
ncbi:MAG: hypothetical protein AcusKO_17760 [Acuticoccus sp.]